MAGERTFVVKFISDVLGATKGIKKVGDDLNTLGKQVDTNLGSKFKSIMPSFKTMAVAGTAAFTAVSAAAYKAVQSASDLAESQSKVNVVFGNSAKEVNDFAKSSATSFGITRQAALEATGTYGNLFQAFGVGQGEAAEMSTTLVGLAADLASFNNTTVDDAILALRSGLSGETEPLKRYGVAINDVRLKEEARNMGLYSGKGALDITAKTQAAYALILKDSTLAQGDFERTSGGLANQQRILKAQLSDVTAQVGSVLIPAFLGAVSFINQKVLPAFSDFGKALQEGGLSGAFDLIATKFKETAPKVVDALVSLIGDVYSYIWNKGIPQVLSAAQRLGDSLASFVGKAARQLPAQLVTLLGTIGEWVLSEGIPTLLAYGTRLAGSFIKWIATVNSQLIVGLGGAVVALVAALPDIFAGFVKGLANIAVNAVKGFVGKFDDMKTALANVAVSVVNTLIDVFNKIPLIPNIPKVTLDTKKLGTQVGLTSSQLKDVNAKFDEVGGTLKVASNATKGFNEDLKNTQSAGSGAAKTVKTAKEKLEEYTDALQKSTSAQRAFTKAQKDSKTAETDLTTAKSDVSKAQENLNRAVAGYGADSVEAKKAQNELEKAQRSVERAGYRVEQSVFAVADAEKSLAEVRADPESTPQAIREAEIDLAEAKLATRDAIDDQTEATDELATSQSTLNELINGAIIGSDFYTKFSDALTDAKKRQTDAEDRLADAIGREADAQERLNDANEKAEELAKKYPKIAAGVGQPGATGVSNPVTGIPNPVGMQTPAQIMASQPMFGIQERMANRDFPKVEITVNAGLGASGIEVGQEIDQYLREYASFTGQSYSFGSIGSIF